MSSGKTTLSSELRDEILRLEGTRKIVVFPRSGPIFTASRQSPGSLYLVESGFVKLTWISPSGEEVISRFSGPGDVFGDDILWRERPRRVTADALLETVLQEISSEAFLRAAAVQPELWRWMAGVFAARENDLEGRLLLESTRDVEFRILYTLAELASLFRDTAGGCTLPITQKELASYVGATRETTSSTLNSIARRGLVRLGRRLLVLPSLSALEAAVRERPTKTAASGRV